MKINRLAKYSISLLAALSLAACGNGNQAGAGSADGQVKVGVLQFMEHESLDQARQGFEAELADNGYKAGDKLELAYSNAQGDQSNLQGITQQFANSQDLVLSIATPAAQAMLNADQSTPQLFTTVTDPVSAGLVQSIEKPGRNMTGTSDSVDVAKVIDLLLTTKDDIKTIGVIYNSSEVNSEVQYQQAKEYIESKGLKVEQATVTSTNEVQTAITGLANRVDAVYLPTDNTVASSIATIGKVLMETKTPSVAGFDAGVEGALCAYGVDYEALGRQTAKMALRILEDGQDPANMPVEYSETFTIRVNQEMADALGIDAQALENTKI
ncbi:ABC transporter substrate-binding protein [Aerococcus urinaehominis]|uniref:ABC transporter substrate-binding protein n=1 Tax=Aerococcus urinaehominis TaxID=128944 RepID=A0A120IAX9_9LACT|nr:ABC transporter substrate-binding protein [Aerococcus urinaehominis]AMB99488.1 ABC transporter substrate-binding protein [Aerococcus urinaehominis]SDM26699.1 putative ABC transport system substrate-binding protein [Aerococcus urinaehominis]